MDILTFLVGFAAALLIAYLIFNKKKKAVTKEPIRPTSEITEESTTTNFDKYTYTKKTFFFTKNELFFYRDLSTAIEGMELVIFSKVRVADVIDPQKSSPNWKNSFTRIRSKHLDFVLCSLPQVRPVLAIELDDSSHERADRKERDQFVDYALSNSGLPILHVKGSGGLREKIENMLQK